MKCVVCGNDSWVFLFYAKDRMFGISGTFSEYRCNICGVVRLEPQPVGKELKRYYPSESYYSYKRKGNPDFFGTLRRFLIRTSYTPGILPRLIRTLVRVPAMPKPIPGTILDVGCGNGETLTILQALGWKCYGLDNDRQAIGVAKKQGLENVSVGSYEDIRKHKNNIFDAIRFYHVIEHLDNPSRALKLAYQKLKRGGDLIIGTPNSQGLIAKIGGMYWYNLDAPRHLYLFNPQNIRMLLKKHGFHDVRMYYSSVGGWVGTLQYATNTDLINNLWMVLLFYPLERFLDFLHLGDVFIIHAKK